METSEIIKRLSNYTEVLGGDVMLGGDLRIKAADVLAKMMDLAAAEMELDVLGGIIKRQREALENIAGKCENFLGTNCFEAGRVIGHEFSAYSVCHPCIARAALDAKE